MYLVFFEMNNGKRAGEKDALGAAFRLLNALGASARAIVCVLGQPRTLIDAAYRVSWITLHGILLWRTHFGIRLGRASVARLLVNCLTHSNATRQVPPPRASLIAYSQSLRRFGKRTILPRDQNARNVESGQNGRFPPRQARSALYDSNRVYMGCTSTYEHLHM
ncbi:hypothetical protein CAOG_010169 [Capsaspora owczarzaki ATCC 30864]|uniref:Uncharacterized protein n=1 Tax=Capsaspora owczarzaki (strain ATCC 30864) TaxID=595528 RepID=A0A0D2W0Z6_CAPO3|nr:hypothetical protein CAOG_010169 [Capsaspora owczarzaki ATCC 30864]